MNYMTTKEPIKQIK